MIKPLHKFVLIKKEEKENKTASGIVLSTEKKEVPSIASVIAVGDECTSSLKENDRVIYKEYSNGVRIGSVPNHKNPTKKTGSNKSNSDIGQSWFPKDWDDNKILLAGTYTANFGTGNDIIKKAVFDDVEVVIFLNDSQVGTICPNNMRQPKGDEWENARD